MNLLIFGVSGPTGHQLVNQSLSQGHTVAAFVRDPSRLKIRHEKLKVVKSNVLDDAALADAIKGQDAVLSAVGASSAFKFDPVAVDVIGKIITTMEELNVLRFIYLSFIGVSQSRANGGLVIRYIAPKLLKTEIEGHEARKKMIRGSKMNWTIVHAPTLTNGKWRSIYRKGENLSSNSFVVAVSCGDVADLMPSQCDDVMFNRKAVGIMY